MTLAILAFLFAVAAVFGVNAAITRLPGAIATRRLDQRLRDVTSEAPGTAAVVSDATVVKHTAEGPLPALDRFFSEAPAGSKLRRLIEQSGVKTTPSTVLMTAVIVALALALVAALFIHVQFVGLAAGVVGAFLPFAWLMHKRSSRLRRFEEQFPEALDLLSRAIRAGHAFQTALGMAADELPAPVGPELKTTFDQQNYGLPLRDALNEFAERVGILDVRFFVTAVLIQRDTGGNLAEILDNLAYVVRERFKILRQVRVHTAHGRFTGYVLLCLPPFLAVALNIINGDHMGPLFHERLGQMMLGAGIVLQTVGYFWIRKVVKIEV
jgi:tight adherence protein B